MRAVVQRSVAARVEVDGTVVGAISHGLVAFVGTQKGDTEADYLYTLNKIVGLRVFPDETGRMARSIKDIDGGLLIVPQFTVFGDVRRGLRPAFDEALPPELAEPCFHRFVEMARAIAAKVATGRFRADMRVYVENDGPVTILIDSRKQF